MNFLKDASKRGKTYAYTLLACVIAIALIGLASIWGIAPINSTLYKLVVTFISIGALSGFLFTLNSEADKLISKRISYIIGGCAIGMALIVITQIWTDFLGDILFGKIISTLLVIGLLGAFAIAIFDDFFENKKLKDDNYLD